MTETIKRADPTWPKKVKKFYYTIIRQYDFEPDTFEIFLQACNALARCYEAKALLDEKGICYTTDSGLIKTNPMCEVEKSARNQFLQAMKLLGISDIEEKGPVGRPPRPAI